MKIRSITIFAALASVENREELASLGTFAQAARRAYNVAGLDVQTVRLATAMPSPPPPPWREAPAEAAARLEAAARAHGFEYIALGPLDQTLLPHLPAMLAATQSLFASAVLLPPCGETVDIETLRTSARVIREAMQIEGGFGNLRFAALAHVPPLTPFFPAAYHDGGPPTFAIATQAADLALVACRGARDADAARHRLIAALEIHAERIAAVARRLDRAEGPHFVGIDFSPAPFPTPEESIGAALEALSGVPLGAAGTLTAAATLTDALRQAHFPRAGFCGLMLPVLEDTVLARRAAEGRLHIAELLQWSAVCGTGLDTVPLPGDVSETTLQRLLLDVATLAARLRKPLTARLMPLPGKRAGDPVHFDFAYFADGGVLAAT